MRLSKAGVSVNEQRVVGLSRLVRNGNGGGMSKFVGVSNNEVIECISLHLRKNVIEG